MNKLDRDSTTFPIKNPADDPAWGRAVCRAHGLRQVNFSTGLLRADLFSAGGRRPTFFSAPYFSDGGVYNSSKYIDDQSLADLRFFLEEKNARYILLKSRVPLSASRDNIAVDLSYFTLTLDLRGGLEHLWDNVLRAKTRNQVRSGLKWNPVTRVGGVELIDDFHRLFARCMRDLGTPVYGKTFFKAILEEFGERVISKISDI